MEKLYNKDGHVAVLVSPGFGAGWSTWEDIDPRDKRYAELVCNKKIDEAIRLAEEEGLFAGGLEDVEIKWLAEGTKFRIDEYDGAESLILPEDEKWGIV